MNVLELFSGTGTLSRIARERGHETLTVDIDPMARPDILADIRDLSMNDIIHYDGGDFWPDFIWASPPCQKFSIARVYDNWAYVDEIPIPTSEAAIDAIWTVKHTLRLIENLEPVIWILENPVGMLSKMPFMGRYEVVKITQCQYGKENQKPTHLWGNAINSMEWREPCHPGDDCHKSAPRGSWGKGTVQGMSGRKRSALPEGLCQEILRQVEVWR